MRQVGALTLSDLLNGGLDVTARVFDGEDEIDIGPVGEQLPQ